MRPAILTATLLATAFVASEAAAQRFSWQFHGGGIVPLSAYVHDGLRVTEGTATADGGEQLTARLIEQYTNPGFQVGMTVLLDRFEIRYMFQLLSWDRAETWCTGDGGAVRQVPSGLDDALVDYRCADSDPILVDSLDESDLDSVFLHVVSIGYRIPLDVGPDTLQVYLAGAPGLAISSYNDVDDSSVLGFDIGLGGGVDWFLTRGFGLGLEARYHLLLTGPVEPFQTAANRARARDDLAIQAVMDAFHYAALTLGLQINFR